MKPYRWKGHLIRLLSLSLPSPGRRRPCCNSCLVAIRVLKAAYFFRREMTEFAVSFWTPVHMACLLRPQAGDLSGLGKLILLIRKRGSNYSQIQGAGWQERIREAEEQ